MELFRLVGKQSIKKNIISIIIGLSLVGFGGPPVFILGLLELSKIVKKISINYDQNTINDIASAMNNLFVSIGDLLGPIIGGFLSSHFGFKICCIIIFIFFLIFSFIFYHFYDKGIYHNDDKSNSIIRNDNAALNEQLFK